MASGTIAKCVIICFLILTACGVRPGSLRPLADERPALIERNSDFAVSKTSGDTAIITYLGCGGLLVGRNGQAILVDPFFSNQKFMRIGRSLIFGSRAIRPDKDAVNKGIDEIISVLEANKLALLGVLVALSHYDHLMDVPAIVNRLPGRPRVLVNRTGYNICHALLDSSRTTILEDHMTSAEKLQPVGLNGASGSVHVYPIPADHNPHFRHIKFFSGEKIHPTDNYADPWQRTRANLWLEGSTFSFLVDFLDDTSEIAFRIFIQSSSCNPPAGLPPTELAQSRKTDVAFLGVVSYHFSPEYPCAQLDLLRPREIIWIHWEDFFRRYGRPAKTVRGTDIPAFFRLPCVGKYDIPGKLMLPLTTIRLLY